MRKGTVRLQPDVARRIRAGHPWVYREALGQRPFRGTAGEPIELVDLDGEFVGHGIYDGESAIAVRVFSRNPSRIASDELVAERVAGAIALRRSLFDFERDTCVRLINGEADGLPALFVDRYGDYLVAQIFTPAVERFIRALYDQLERTLGPAAIYEQQRYRSLAGDSPKQGAELVRGAAAPVELEVREGDLTFWVDVTSPLSTGLFPDLREGRRAIAQWARGRRVLNLFSYTGAISVYAQHGGATEVAAVDVSAKGHARARKNFALNGFDPEQPEHIVGDAFSVLARFAERGRRFDMVVIDPPAFASGSRGGKPWSAVKDYNELVAASLSVLQPGGVLAAASATHKMSLDEFELALAEGAMQANTNLRIVDRRWLPPDFPGAPAFPEGNYLKFVVAIRG
ncbi:MAG TPA: class I SAM-dependent rRNA methyltransferase [Kofleriaceae bacterium]|nr:class I SAM-dependent rRNA methyltransferase [Kofleriaceae bacterium]